MADKPKLSLVIDSITLQTDGMLEVDGILSVPAVIARHMVYDYDGTKILKPFDELEAAAQFADGIPVTRAHPDEGIVTNRKEVLGYLRNPIAEVDELKGTLEVSDTELQTDIKSGKIKEVSGGFFCTIDATPGTLDGTDYDAVHRDIYMNHVAIVDNGRCSIADGCGLKTDSRIVDAPADLIGKIDTAIGMATAEWGSGALKDLLVEIKEMVMAKGATDSIEEVIAERDSLVTEVQTMTQTIETLTQERDAIRDEAEKIVKAEKDAIIVELMDAQKTKTEDALRKLKLDELKTELEMVQELRADKLTMKQDGKMKSLDDAYRGVKP